MPPWKRDGWGGLGRCIKLASVDRCIAPPARYHWTVMSRTFASALVVSVLGLAFAACDSGDGYGESGYGGIDYGPAYGCGAYTSCQACTPVNGCGWCYDSDGTGTCTASPSLCKTPSFSWTWNPEGCRVSAEAGVTPTRDASADAHEASVPADAGPSDAAPACTIPEGANTFVQTDAGGTGCLPVSVNNVCSSSADYPLACFGVSPGTISTPASSLGCKVSSVPTPSDVMFYCCSCGPLD
jgi:hypothetical protein